MGLVIAYFHVWMFVVLYVARLGVRQRRLEQAVEDLEERLRKADRRPATVRAA